MSLEFIDLRRGEGVSSLEIASARPFELRVVGGLPHGVAIEPRSDDAAKRLIAWLMDWRTEHAARRDWGAE